LLEELLAKFKNFKKQVFFANNSDQLSSNDFAYIQDVAQVLKQYPELSIVLEGWASTKGKVDYNKQLSMRRSESVEQALLSNGISPVRIVSSFRGEDKSSTEAMARRVDMSIILK
jgi:outer membrane protein OmpA-like peptidoglycan-associated protein